MSATTTTYTADKQIFKYPVYTASPVTLDASQVSADTNGKKIVKAGSVIGTAVTGSTVLTDHAKGKVVTGSTAEGILMYDVDCTAGDAVGAIATRAVVYKDALPAAITSDSAAALKLITQEN